MQYRKNSVLFLFAVLCHVAWAEKYDTCLDYWTVGMSGCKPETVSKTTVVSKILPPPVMIQQETEPPQVIIPKTSKLDTRIDKFMKSHGKPPREFVAFHLEPTLENALKWVRKYNDMLKRNVEITRAWMQAEAIYDKAEVQGQDVSGLVTEPSTPVPDFGIAMPKMPAIPGIPSFDEANLGKFDINGTIIAGLDIQKATEGLTSNNVGTKPFGSTTPLNDGHIGGVSDVMHIDYYFSVECPYCLRFELPFQEIIEELGNRVSVTCVDITPSGQRPENIRGKVNCDWRAAYLGELSEMGVKATPSLIISRGEGQPMERVSGYVEPTKLKSYLLK